VTPELVRLRQPRQLRGMAVRTTNADEADPTRARIPALWQRFRQSSVAAQLAGRLVYGVYTDYAADATGPYTLVVGGALPPDGPSGPELVSVLIPAGQYLVFTGSGDIPAAALGAWRQVWAYFARADAPARAFSTDFEQYDPADPSRVRIHIALSAAVRQALA